MAWWDWPQWERMIDWMALHGINMPLAVTGQEAVWQKVYRDLGLDRRRDRPSSSSGPAYLPFGWMGCIDGWGGPLPQAWIDRHAELQKKILARQRELGMTPVLQGFTGPRARGASRQVSRRPSSSGCPVGAGSPARTSSTRWTRCSQRIGKAFVEEQTRQFGTDHLYASDTFIEMSPPEQRPGVPGRHGPGASTGRWRPPTPRRSGSCRAGSSSTIPSFWKPPQAKALLGAVPDDRMILLDLFCEASPAWNKTEAFYGKPWVWCIIQRLRRQGEPARRPAADRREPPTRP